MPITRGTGSSAATIVRPRASQEVTERWLTFHLQMSHWQQADRVQFSLERPAEAISNLPESQPRLQSL
jgi:hypothetical protein